MINHRTKLGSFAEDEKRAVSVGRRASSRPETTGCYHAANVVDKTYNDAYHSASIASSRHRFSHSVASGRIAASIGNAE